MLSRISQLRQTISEELEQASQARPGADPIAIIERNKALLTSESPNVEDIIMDIESDPANESTKTPSNSANTNNGDPKNGEPIKGEPKNVDPKNVDPKNGAPNDGKPTNGKPTNGEPTNGEPTNGGPTNGGPANEKDLPADTNTKSPEPSRTESPALKSEKQEIKEQTPPKTESRASNRSVPQKTGDSQRQGAPQRQSDPQKQATPPKEASSEDSALAAKLAKFARYEEKYPQLLKAYKIEKKRNELVKLYESVLAEHTPCTSIAQPQELVEYLKGLTSKNNMLQKELTSSRSELDNTKRSLDTLKRSSEQSTAEINSLKQQLAKFKTDLADKISELAAAKKASSESQANARADAELRAKVDSLESQLSSAEQSRDAAQKSQTTLKSQVDEMSTRLSEVMAECDVIRDELVDTERLSHQRLNELNSLKDSLRHRERDRRQSADNINDQITALMAEKEQLEAEVEQLNKRIIRESEHLQTQIKSLRSQLRDSEEHERELRKQLTQAHTRSDTQLHLQRSEQEATGSRGGVDTLPAAANGGSLEASNAALSEARASAVNAAKANELLKEVNADNVLRIEKLQKTQRALAADLDQLRHENAVLKKRRSSVTSTSMGKPGNSNDSAEKQQAYMKNVILGFAEHKDQRKTLLPVLATLLGFSESESDKFMRML